MSETSHIDLSGDLSFRGEMGPRTSAVMYQIDETGSLDALAALRPAWSTLHTQTPHATFFQSLEWLETYWRHYGAKQRLRVLVVRDGNEVTGIVPLTVLRESTKIGRVHVLTYPQDYWGSYYGPIGPHPRETLRAALDHVRRTRRDWDLLDLRFSPPNDLDPSCGEQELRAAGFSCESRETDFTSLVDLPATMDDYQATRTAKWRNNCRRWNRRLGELGEVRYVRYRPRGADFADADPRWDLYDACEAVARKSWQGSSLTGTTITHEAVRPFLRDMHAVASAAGAADVNLLYLNDEPIAFFYGYHYRGYLYGMRIGFDESKARVGVGNLLYLRVIEDSISRGDYLFDLGPGSLEAKKNLVTRVVPIFRRTYGTPYSLRGLLWRAKRVWDSRREGAAGDASDRQRNSSQSPTAVTINDTTQAAV